MTRTAHTSPQQKSFPPENNRFYLRQSFRAAASPLRPWAKLGILVGVTALAAHLLSAASIVPASVAAPARVVGVIGAALVVWVAMRMACAPLCRLYVDDHEVGIGRLPWGALHQRRIPAETIGRVIRSGSRVIFEDRQGRQLASIRNPGWTTEQLRLLTGALQCASRGIWV